MAEVAQCGNASPYLSPEWGPARGPARGWLGQREVKRMHREKWRACLSRQSEPTWRASQSPPPPPAVYLARLGKCPRQWFHCLVARSIGAAPSSWPWSTHSFLLGWRAWDLWWPRLKTDLRRTEKTLKFQELRHELRAKYGNLVFLKG